MLWRVTVDEGVSATGAVWRGAVVDLQAAEHLANELLLPMILAKALVARGVTSVDDADRFLNPTADQFHDPKLLPDYEAATKEILGARERGERIYVHGDYDVDGVTSAALFTRFLSKLGCDVVPHVPHRMREGYGIHIDAVGWAKEQGSHLFLTCDCGVGAHEQIDAVNAAGMRAVVTDHHEVGDSLPKAHAVVNPHRDDSHYPFPEISGAGVAFKLCMGIADELGIKRDHYLRAYLDLAVLGTVADVMPLVDENRVITSLGLPLLRDSKKQGVRALIKVANLEGIGQITARHIGFQLGPRINAVGRLEDAATALDLLLSDDENAAAALAQVLEDTNQERRTAQIATIAEAVALVDEQPELPAAIVVAKEGWHPGVIGIVAGRLVELYRRPAFVVSIGSDGRGRGSARSIEGFHLKEALDHVRDLLLGGGGHAMAAGFGVDVAVLEQLAVALRAHAAAILSPEDFLPVIEYDAEATLEEAGPESYQLIKRLEPFGNGNPEPAWLVRGLEIVGLRPTSKPEHVGITFAQDGRKRSGMAFGIGESFQERQIGDRIDAVVKMEESTYRGNVEFRWTVLDHRLCG